MGSATQSAYLSTAGGGIQVKRCDGELRAATAGGSVEIGDVGGGAILETSGGSIRLASAKGVVRATTSGGGIRLSGLTHGVTAKNAAGPISAEFTASKGSFSESYLETSVGDVIVDSPPDLPVTVRATIDAAMGHKMMTDFPEVKVSSEGGEWGAAREIYGQGASRGRVPCWRFALLLAISNCGAENDEGREQGAGKTRIFRRFSCVRPPASCLLTSGARKLLC